MNMYQDLEVIGDLNVNESKGVNDYISSHYPWLPSRMDFSKIPNHSHIHWGSVSDSEVEEFVLSSSLSEFEYVAVLYSSSEPMFIFKLEYAAKEFDYISKGKQMFVLFGVKDSGSNWELCKSNIIYAHTGFDIWSTNVNA